MSPRLHFSDLAPQSMIIKAIWAVVVQKQMNAENYFYFCVF